MTEINSYLNTLLSEKKIDIGAFDPQGCVMISMYNAIIYVTQATPESDCTIDYCYDGEGETVETVKEYISMLQAGITICETLNRLLAQSKAERNLNSLGEDTYK